MESTFLFAMGLGCAALFALLLAAIFSSKSRLRPQSRRFGDADAWRRVEQLDLEPIVDLMVKKKQWTVERARAMAADYRRFLYLCATNRTQVIVPWTEELDDFWHMHMLDTRRYAADCQAVLGRFLHHNPHLHVGLPKQVAAHRATQALLAASFPKRAKKRRDDPAASSDGGGCGAPVFVACSSGSSCGGTSDGGGSSCGGSSCGGGGCGGGGCGGGGCGGG